MGVPDGKITVIKNGVDFSVFKANRATRYSSHSIGLKGRFVASYVGTHGMAHGLDTILEAANILRDDPGIGFLMVGDGADKQSTAGQTR